MSDRRMSLAEVQAATNASTAKGQEPPVAVAQNYKRPFFYNQKWLEEQDDDKLGAIAGHYVSEYNKGYEAFKDGEHAKAGKMSRAEKIDYILANCESPLDAYNCSSEMRAELQQNGALTQEVDRQLTRLRANDVVRECTESLLPRKPLDIAT